MKTRSLEEVRAEVQAMDLEPGIKDLVIGLRRWEVDTDTSCQGHVDEGLGFPWVLIPAHYIEKVGWLVCAFSFQHPLDNPWVLKPLGCLWMLQPENHYGLTLEEMRNQARKLGEFLQNLPETWPEENLGAEALQRFRGKGS